MRTAYHPHPQRVSWEERQLTRPSTRIRQVRTSLPPREDHTTEYLTTSASLTTLLPTFLPLHRFLQPSTHARLPCQPSTLISSRRTLSQHIYCGNHLLIRAPLRHSRCTFVGRLESGNISQSRPTTPSSTRTTTTIGHQMKASLRVIRKNPPANQCTGKRSRATFAQFVLALTLYLSYLVCSAHYSGIICCDHGGHASSARLYHGPIVLIQTMHLLGSIFLALDSLWRAACPRTAQTAARGIDGWRGVKCQHTRRFGFLLLLPTSRLPLLLVAGCAVGCTSLSHSCPPGIFSMQLFRRRRLRNASIKIVGILSGIAAFSGLVQVAAAPSQGGVHLPMYRTVASTSHKRSSMISAVGLGDFLDV